MQLEDIKLVRDTYLVNAKYIRMYANGGNTIVDNRRMFLSWDDTSQLLTVVGPNPNSREQVDENRSSIMFVQVIPYSEITQIEGVPNVSTNLEVEKAITALGITGDLKKRIVDRFDSLLKDDAYIN